MSSSVLQVAIVGSLHMEMDEVRGDDKELKNDRHAHTVM